MATGATLTGLVQYLRRQCGDGPTDGELLARFVRWRDEAAFADLVGRHGRLVLGVARRHLPDRQAAEDVVQATFLALARSAARLGRLPSLVNWLYVVAVRQARKARLRFARRSASLERLPQPSTPGDPLDEVSGRSGGVQIQVLADGKPLLDPPPELSAGESPRSLRLPVPPGAKELTLIVEFGRGGDVQDHVDWADARIITGGAVQR